MEDRQALLEQDKMKKFLQLLEENGMSEQKQDMEFLAGYIDQMELQFASVLNELKNVRKDLNAIQDKTIRATAIRAVDKVVNKVEATKGHLIKLKNHVMNTVDKAVSDFKNQGKSALVSAMKSLNVKGMLVAIHGGCQHVVQSSGQGIDNITKLGNEIHAVNSHMKNVGRVFVGKEAQELVSRQTDKGLLAKVQEGLFFSMKAFTTMSQKTEHTLYKVKNMENKHDKKSVRSDLKELKDKQQISGKTKEIAGKETELGQR